MKRYLVSIVIFILTFVSFMTLKSSSYAEGDKTTTFASGDIVDGKNITQDETTYHDPVSIKDGEKLRVRVRVVNNGTVDAQNVKLAINLGNPQAPSAMISADNADSVSDAVGLNPGGTKLDLIAGTVMEYGPSCVSGCSVALIGNQVNLGTVSPSEAQSYQISFEVNVSGVPGDKQKAIFKSGNIFDGGNRSKQGSNWVDPIPADPGDAVEFRTQVINIGNVTAQNVAVKVVLPDTRSLTLVPKVTVSASNADAVMDTATVQVSGTTTQLLSYLPGHTLKYGPGCANGCALPDGITVHGISIGDVEVGSDKSFQVTFKVYVSNEAGPTASPTASPTPTITPTGSPTPTPTGSPTASPTATPTATPSPTPTYTPGTPNSCNGTCGSNENCQGGFFCFQGFCRNPACPNDSACGCVNVTPTPQVLSAVAPPVLPKTGFDVIEGLLLSLSTASFGQFLFKKFKLV